MTRPQARHRVRRIDDRLDAHHAFPVDRVAIRDLQRDRRAGGASVTHAAGDVDRVALDLLPRAAAVAELPAPQIAVDVRGGDRNAGGHAVEDRDEPGPVRLAGGDEPHVARGRAARITASGASRPVHSVNERAAWYRSIESPSTTTPFLTARALLTSGVIAGGGHDVHDAAGARGSASPASGSSPCRPSGVAFDDSVDLRRDRLASATGPPWAVGPRPRSRGELLRASARPARDLRPRCRARAERRHRRARRHPRRAAARAVREHFVPGRRSLSARSKPYTSVLSPTRRVPRRTIVLTAPIRRASLPASSTRRSVRSLCGIVMFAPSDVIPAQRVDEILEPVRRDVARLVVVWQAERGERGVVHRWRERMRHGMTEAGTRSPRLTCSRT